MDHHYQHPTQVHVVRACHNSDAADLVAVAGEHSLDILLVTDATCTCIASFHIGSRITALAWSPNTVSPSSSDEWKIELVAAAADYGLSLLTKSSSSTLESTFQFGGGLSGHHGKVNDISFCGGWGEDSSRYVATVSDDKMLMVWDLYPTVDISSKVTSPMRSSVAEDSPTSIGRPQPTAYVIPFSHPLTSINAHPSTSKEFLVSDCRGSIFMTDWRSDPEDQVNLRHSTLVELVEPLTLSGSKSSHVIHQSGSVAWRVSSTEIVGGVYGSKFAIWDISRLRGGKPFITGNTFAEGGHRFRWCPTYPEYFAISTKSPAKGAIIHVHNINHAHAQPSIFNISSRPHSVQDFEFMAIKGIPRIAAAVGRMVIIFSIGVDV